MATLTIDADAVQNVANQVQQIAQSFEQEKGRLNQQASALQAACHWNHIGAEDQIHQALQQLGNIENLLKEAHDGLVKVVQDARQTEAAIQSS